MDIPEEISSYFGDLKVGQNCKFGSYMFYKLFSRANYNFATFLIEFPENKYVEDYLPWFLLNS